jgi:hypothetical protein
MPFPKGRRLPTGRPMRRPRQGQAEKVREREVDEDEIKSVRDELEFYEASRLPPDPNAVKIWRLAKSLSRSTEPGRTWGQITPKHLDVLRVLLWALHNGQVPSYETITKEGACSLSTVTSAIKALKSAGIFPASALDIVGEPPPDA